MAVAARVSHRFLDQQTARRVASRFVWAMSAQEAKQTLGFPSTAHPTDAEVNDQYRRLVRNTIQKDPEAARSQVALKDLNIAKDTLLGKLETTRQPATAPGRAPRRPPGGGFNPEDEVKREPPPEPPPVPPGELFSSALHGLGNVDWKIATDGTYSQEYVREEESQPPKGYWVYTNQIILLGKTASHYVFAKIVRRSHTRGDLRDKTVITRWESKKLERPIDSHDLLKLAPKVISGLREGARGRAKFTVLEGTLTEERLLKLRGTLSLPDAILGSGMLAEGAAAPRGRKVQVELEPVLNKEKYKAYKADPSKRGETHLAYDWFLYVNGKRHELTEREVEGLKKNYLLLSVFSYDYQKGKVNLTRLKGSRMKMGPKESLEAVVKSLDPGPVRDAVARAAEAFA